MATCGVGGNVHHDSAIRIVMYTYFAKRFSNNTISYIIINFFIVYHHIPQHLGATIVTIIYRLSLRQPRDEIQEYEDRRSVAGSESCWRTFDFDMYMGDTRQCSAS
eukprot:2825152-Pyramimonas_sp.AAC.1